MTSKAQLNSVGMQLQQTYCGAWVSWYGYIPGWGIWLDLSFLPRWYSFNHAENSFFFCSFTPRPHSDGKGDGKHAEEHRGDGMHAEPSPTPSNFNDYASDVQRNGQGARGGGGIIWNLKQKQAITNMTNAKTGKQYIDVRGGGVLSDRSGFHYITYHIYNIYIYMIYISPSTKTGAFCINQCFFGISVL